MKRNTKSHPHPRFLLFNNCYFVWKLTPHFSSQPVHLHYSIISSSLLKMATFSDMCKVYYEHVKGEDEILYPGYHIRLLDEASKTNIYQTREDLIQCLDYHESFLKEVVKDLVSVELQLAEIGLDTSQVLKVCVTTILFLDIIHFFAKIYVSTIFVPPCYLIYSVFLCW